LVARYFQALGAAGPLALGPASVKDMYFRHQLGKMVGINTILLVISPFSGGIIGGPILEHLGWRWSQWISGVLMFVALFGYIFLAPEVSTLDCLLSSSRPLSFDYFLVVQTF
jgi:MFS family permease